MKYAVLIAAMFASTAFAAEKAAIEMSPNEAFVLSSALSSLDGYQKISHNARGEDQAVLVPYDLGDARITIAHDIAVLAASLKEAQTAAQGLDSTTQVKLFSTKVSIDLLTFDAATIKISNNPIPPSVLAGLAPVCPSCAALDAVKR